MKKRTSKIWNISKKELEEAINRSTSLLQVIKYFNLDDKGYVYRTLRKKIKEDGIIINFPIGKNSNKNRKFGPRKKIEEILIQGNDNKLPKKRLISEGILKNYCYICGITDVWNNQPLTLQLDHINGINNDSRLENLRLLCPNCHSQTKTFAGKRFSKGPSLCKCGSVKSKTSLRCDICYHKSKRRFSDEELLLILNQTKKNGFEAVGREYGVTGNAVKKWLKNIAK